MIQFKSISIRNFLSFGNTKTTFNFDNGLIRIVGRNGEGKSTVICEGMYYCLFGKPYRDINLSQLLNNINKKELEVSLTFNISDSEYRIERGMKPNYFRIFKNDVIVPVPSSTRSYQTILEEDILHMDSNIFEQINLKSLTKDMSFLNLKKPQKREIIENILDIKVFTAMNKTTKDKVDNITKSLLLDNKDLEHAISSIANEKDNLLRLKQINENIEKDLIEKKKIAQDEIIKLQHQNEILDASLLDIQVINEKKVLFQEEITKLNEKISITKLKLREEVKILQDEYRIKQQYLDDDILQVGKDLKVVKSNILDKIKEHSQKISECQNNNKQEKQMMISKIDVCNKYIQKVKEQISLLNIKNTEIQTKIDFMTKTCTDCIKAKELMYENTTNGINDNNKTIEELKFTISNEMSKIVEIEKDISLSEENFISSTSEIHNEIVKCNNEMTTFEDDYTLQINNLNKQKEELMIECRKKELTLTEQYDKIDEDNVERIRLLNLDIKDCNNRMKVIVDKVSK